MAAEPAQPLRTVASTVKDVRTLSTTGHELTIHRRGLVFQAGMLITVHGRDPTEDRDYTIASGERDPDLRLLYRHIPNGRLTSQLVRLQPGDPLRFTGPSGRFVVQDPDRPLVFVATGTGIAPCRAYARSHPGLDLTILHGVRDREDLFYRDEFTGFLYHSCVSSESANPRRVTDLLRTLPLPPRAHYYLCGAYEMIFEVSSLLAERDVPPTCIFTEAYYYRATD